MNKRIALGLAALSLAGVTAGIALAADDPAPAADAPMPAAGYEDQGDMIVVDGAGMLVPGYEGEVADMIVE